MSNKGFTLVECLVVVVILALLALFAYPSYSKYVRDARLKEALKVMLDNQRALEQHYAQRGHFKKNSTTWADLPFTETEHFCIKLQGNPRGTNHGGQYTMKAVALSKDNEPRVLVVNQDNLILLCEQSSSDCSEKGFFRNPARRDSQCSVYQE